MRGILVKRLTSYALTGALIVGLTPYFGAPYFNEVSAEEFSDVTLPGAEEGVSVILEGGAVSVGEDYELIIDPNEDSELDPMYQRSFGEADPDFCEEMDPETLQFLMDNPISLFTAGGRDGYDELLCGVDVSHWQGSMNWQTAYNRGVRFAIVRAAHRAEATGVIYDDADAGGFITGANAAGMSVGLYCYSQAISKEEAREEANRLILCANKYKSCIDLPLVMDFEYGAGNSGRLYNAHLSKQAATDIILEFCKTVKDAGYRPMVYANKSTLNSAMDTSQILGAGYDIWGARYYLDNNYPGMGTADAGWTDPMYAANTVSIDTMFDNDFEFWQWTSKGKGSYFGAASTFIDLDYWFKGEAANLSLELPKTWTVNERSVDVVVDGEVWWNKAAVVDGVNTPLIFKDAQGGDLSDKATVQVTAKAMLKPDAKNLTIYTSNGYGKDVFGLVFDLSYNSEDNTIGGTLNHIEDYRVRFDSVPEGYDGHVFFDEGGRYGSELLSEYEGGPLVAAAGRNAKTVYVNRYVSGLNDVVAKTTYNLTFNTTNYTYEKELAYTEDYKIVISVDNADFGAGGTVEIQAQGPYHATYDASARLANPVVTPKTEAVIEAKDGQGWVYEKRVYSVSYSDTEHKYIVNGQPEVTDYCVTVSPPESYTDKAIWLDGIRQEAFVSGDGKWRVYMGSTPEAVPKVATIYSYSSAESGSYPVGMKAYFVSAKTGGGYETTCCEGLTDAIDYEGFSMRTVAPAGLRYRGLIDKNVKNTLKTTGIDGYKLYEYGTIEMSGSAYASKPLVVGGESVRQIKSYYYETPLLIRDRYLYLKDDDYCISVMNSGFSVKQYDMEIYARNYIIMKKGNEYLTVYGAPYGKSLYRLSKQVLEHEIYEEGTEKYNYIKSIVDDYDTYKASLE